MHEEADSGLVNPRVSVDCVLIGFDGTQLCILLVRQIGSSAQSEELNRYKLPGSLIYEDEDLDDAAHRVLTELTGLKNISMIQFRAFGSKDRTKNPKDVKWLERFHSLNERIDRIVTIAYLALLKIDRRNTRLSNRYEVCWMPIKQVSDLAFDHKLIVEEALTYVRKYVESTPSTMFTLLPRKFTMLQLRVLHEVIYDKPLDIRNFHKKVAQMDYIVPLDEYERGVSHRAARYYRFDRVNYHKQRNE